ncbi:hypothetical protein KP509_14G055300 [Ceratopteris richardii]|uniref:Uncharacterized protein n=1 Tax=Ceratopteris richardii TaxID=49495 RepID=A0A8T2TBV9_CERRI|nr:hypothetical protein KP509_14G055300 [Ceratopteris richardii]
MLVFDVIVLPSFLANDYKPLLAVFLSESRNDALQTSMATLENVRSVAGGSCDVYICLII